MLQQAQEILQRYYGYSSFREGQALIIESVLQGKNVLGILPTGGGKSVCYQVPALLVPGTAIVVSPLISLMKDQIDSLESMGISAASLNSTLTAKEVTDRLARAARGEYKLLYIAPERLESERFRYMLRSLSISLIAVDEAHCISQWGHDFRPSYRTLASFIAELPERPQIAAFTATATREVINDIVDQLGIHHDHIYITSFDRPNLKFTVRKSEDKKQFLLDYMAKRPNEAGIVYAATRKEVDSLYEFLCKKRVSAGKYHAGLTDDDRLHMQEQFIHDNIRIMVASNAFGMGIDKSNVRYVIHYNMPKNMEAYYQEAGRAGRDGEPGDCTLLFSPQDVIIQKFLIEQTQLVPERKAYEYKKLQAMADYCHTTRCLRQFILRYFGEEAGDSCGNCTHCQDDLQLEDITEAAQKIFSCIMRMKERFGATLVSQVLKGSRNRKVYDLGFQHLPTYGIMREYTEKDIIHLIHALIAERYLLLTEGQYPIIKLQQRAVHVLKGNEQVLQKFRIAKPVLLPANDRLFEALRQLRKEIAAEERVPPYVVFSDSTLREMSEKVPYDRETMLAIKGVGEAKYDKYGGNFLEVLRRVGGGAAEDEGVPSFYE